MLKLICVQTPLVMGMHLAILWDPWGSDDEIELDIFPLPDLELRSFECKKILIKVPMK